MAKTRPEDLPAGKRRLGHNTLARIVAESVRYYPSRTEAERAWSKIVQNFHYTVEKAQSTVKTTYHEGPGLQLKGVSVDPAWYIRARIHPGCPHWKRFLEDAGVQCEMGTAEEEWYVQPPRTKEELDQMIRGTGGRFLP